MRFAMRLKAGPGGEKPSGAESCCMGVNSQGQVRFYTSCAGYLFGFDIDGTRLWRTPTGCGSACNMRCVGQRLFMTTSNGTAACVDVTDEAIEQARRGKLAEVRTTTSLPTPPKPAGK
ncbi:MAG: PQQ-binding-like beta-propeller repeat protein [Deltaproteobacteria bacterium]|nr:PQQ-binding-like beta-propeller repeat protein [Deltaproteobacteria bacterium]